MFDWQQFSFLAKAAMASASITDEDLTRIFSMPRPPNQITDEVGRPKVNCATISPHPEPDNFRWVTDVRRAAALIDGDKKFIRYADKVLLFFKDYGLFSDSNPLFVIRITTHRQEFEFLFAPIKYAVVVLV
jgi:hypothetical protein